MLIKLPVLFQVFLVVLCNARRRVPRDFGGNCNTDSLAVYKVTLEGRWTRENFPKHYPETRPAAQFSKTYGVSHNVNFTLFKLDEMASKGLKSFCNSANTDIWENDDGTTKTVFDEFSIPKLTNPSDKIESRLFVQSNFSRISLVTKLVPSPDWIIGIDSLSLCRDNRWVEKTSVEGRPYDCGIGSGLTFSSPFWETNPQNPVTKITTDFIMKQGQNYQASSFFYEDKQNLPPIAYFRLQKIKEYVGVKEKSVKRIHQKYRRHDERHHGQRPLKESRHTIDKDPKHVANKTIKFSNVIPDYEAPDCVVSDWGEWSSCSKTCGLGEKFRNRTIIKPSKSGGSPCPTQLSERSWCGSSRCKPSLQNENIENSSYFKW